MVQACIPHRLAALALACALCAGCEQPPVGLRCYEADLVLDGPTYATGFQLMATGRGDLAGWVVKDHYSDACRYRVMRVTGGQVDEVLCLPPDPTGEQRQFVLPVAGDLGGGLYLVGTLPGDADFEGTRVLCWDSAIHYELWDLAHGLMATFETVYGLGWVVRADRFLGIWDPCDASSLDTGWLTLVDDTGQVLRDHPSFSGADFARLDPATRDYFLFDSYGTSGPVVTFHGFDADGQDLPLVIGDAGDCYLAGALAGVQAFKCPLDAGGHSLIVGRPDGLAASVELDTELHFDVALGGQGSVVAVGYDSGRLEVYRYSEDRLALLWVKELSGQVIDIRVGRGNDPLIAYHAMDGTLRVFDLHGWPAMDASSVYPPLVGDVDGFVTLVGDHIQTYRITQLPACATAGGR